MQQMTYFEYFKQQKDTHASDVANGRTRLQTDILQAMLQGFMLHLCGEVLPAEAHERIWYVRAGVPSAVFGRSEPASSTAAIDAPENKPTPRDLEVFADMLANIRPAHLPADRAGHYLVYMVGRLMHCWCSEWLRRGSIRHPCSKCLPAVAATVKSSPCLLGISAAHALRVVL